MTLLLITYIIIIMHRQHFLMFRTNQFNQCVPGLAVTFNLAVKTIHNKMCLNTAELLQTNVCQDIVFSTVVVNGATEQTHDMCLIR